MIEQIQPLASLMTSRVVVTDVVVTSITGLTGELRAAVVVRGDALITVDLSTASIDVIDHDTRTAKIILPPPQVISARVDHEQTRIFSVQATGLWAIVSSDDGQAVLIDQAMKLAQQAITKAASESPMIEQARTRAEALICSFFANSLQWNVTVQWVDMPDSP